MNRLLVALFVALTITVGCVEYGVCDNGVVVVGDDIVITNVWFRPFGCINMTIPWKDAQVAGLVDLLHDDTRTIAAVEGPILKQGLWGRIIQLNIGLASVVAGDEKRGLIETSLNFTPPTSNLTENWSGGVWVGTAFDGTGLWGGYKVFTKF